MVRSGAEQLHQEEREETYIISGRESTPRLKRLLKTLRDAGTEACATVVFSAGSLTWWGRRLCLPPSCAHPTSDPLTESLFVASCQTAAVSRARGGRAFARRLKPRATTSTKPVLSGVEGSAYADCAGLEHGVALCGPPTLSGGIRVGCLPDPGSAKIKTNAASCSVADQLRASGWPGANRRMHCPLGLASVRRSPNVRLCDGNWMARGAR